MLQVHKVNRIEQQLQSRLSQVIISDCDQNVPYYYRYYRFFRKGVFLCHGSPSSTTYRTTLVDYRSTTNSTYLVGIIQNWVSTHPSLIIDGRLMRVSSTCPTYIFSLDEEECETGRHDAGESQRIAQTLSQCAVQNMAL